MRSFGIALLVIAQLVFQAYATGCGDFTDCNACTSGDSGCLWCLSGGDSKQTTCVAASDTAQCTETLGIVENVKEKTAETDNTKSISISEMKLTMRRESSETFVVDLKKKSLPYQLYFFLDLSESMAPVLENVKSSASLLPGAFDNDPPAVKPTFKFGFGSFVDKAIPPFTLNRFKFDVPTYGYKHHVSFTDDPRAFVNVLNSVKVSGNNDRPEGGFDALVQALYCEDLVEWEPLGTNALRTVLMATDQRSHFAGDGVDAGILWPAELKCKKNLFFKCDKLYPSEMMNELYEYDECKCNILEPSCTYHNFIHDYPSVDQVKTALEERDVSLAFVVPAAVAVDLESDYRGVREEYKELVEALGSRSLLEETATISANSEANNFQTVVRDIYYNFFDTTPEFITQEIDDFGEYYRVSSICAEDGSNSVSVNGRSIQLDWICTFTVEEVKVGGFASEDEYKSAIMRSGLWGSFDLMVRSKGCTCPSSFTCSNGATKIDDPCSCECNNGNINGNCDCVDVFKPCTPPNCNGNGECSCGECKCQVENVELNIPGFTGPECKCQTSCLVNNKVPAIPCGGKGVCECGECKCNNGYQGPNCKCNIADSCAASNGKICNGKGTCRDADECSCECTPPWSGDFCEDCDATVNPEECGGPCNECSKKATDSDDPSKDTWGCDCCFSVTDEGHDASKGSLCQWCSESLQCFSREIIVAAQNDGVTLCGSKDNIITETTTTGSGDDTTTTSTEIRQSIIYDDASECPPPGEASTIAVVVGSLLGLLALILLAILLWRLWAFYADKKEWERYEKDKAKSLWQADNNPMYKSSTHEYQNPCYQHE